MPTLRSSAVPRKVLVSLESADGLCCVDVFFRDDGSFGFEEFREDFDGGARWQALGKYDSLTFLSGEAALSSARKQVRWLDKTISDNERLA